jgi:hypothetical protein
VEERSFEAASNCGVTTRMTPFSFTGEYLTGTEALPTITSFRSVPVVVGDESQHDTVAVIGGQYSWGPTLSKIFAEHVSGIDIVVRYVVI